ncbi:MAG TPA: molybdopterin-dependent oxidoreductase [Thermoanaerobaculia bacterium]|nr:molybdopterin-dependent oxidoreductase [Thermoanaerobaculia bacterium]
MSGDADSERPQRESGPADTGGEATTPAAPGGDVAAGPGAQAEALREYPSSNAPALAVPSTTAPAAPVAVALPGGPPSAPLLAAPAIIAAPSEADVERQLARLSRRGFLTLAAGGTAAVLGWRWLISRPRDAGQPWPFRRALQANEALWEALWDPTRLAPTYRRSAAARNPRVNGMRGLDRNADPAAWSLKVEGAAAGPLVLSLADVQALPAHDLVTELRCVEGWTMVVHWTGVRLADFMARFPPAARDGSAADPRQPQRMPPFLALETPGRGYYVGLDLQSALHPQTLLAYAINGLPLTWDHGAPLRLVAPMKYGVKSLKRIGTLRYSFVRPGDFWYEHGYDWYLGH